MKNSPLDFIAAKTNAAHSRYKTGRKISFATFAEDFINGNIDVEGNFEDFMECRADHFEFLSRLRLCGKTGSGQDERGQECDKQQLDKSFHENLR